MSSMAENSIGHLVEETAIHVHMISFVHIQRTCIYSCVGILNYETCSLLIPTFTAWVL